jgi:hypothetical protein
LLPPKEYVGQPTSLSKQPDKLFNCVQSPDPQQSVHFPVLSREESSIAMMFQKIAHAIETSVDIVDLDDKLMEAVPIGILYSGEYRLFRSFDVDFDQVHRIDTCLSKALRQGLQFAPLVSKEQASPQAQAR